MKDIKQNPIQYKVKKSLIITNVIINQPASDDPNTLGHVEMIVGIGGMDSVRVSGMIGTQTAMFDVVALLKAAAITGAKGDPKETRHIENSFVGNFLNEYNISLTAETKKIMAGQYKDSPWWKLIGEVIFTITGDVTINAVYISGISTKGSVTAITGSILGTKTTITSTSEPKEVIMKLIQSLIGQIFGPNFTQGLIMEEVLNQYINVLVAPEIIDDAKDLSAIWQGYLVENYPKEPSEEAKALAEAVANTEHENCLTQLVDFMFNKDATWDPELQLQRNIVGKAHKAEVQLTVVHAVGNFFIKGYVGTRRLRIFKTHSTIQIHATSFEHDFDMDKPTKTFVVYEQAAFEEWLIRLAQRQGELGSNNAN